MGNCKSKENDNKVLVLQTGKLRTSSSEFNIQENLPENVFHRWLPPHLELKYEAKDFAKKFSLNTIDYFNIYDGNDHTVIMGQNENAPVLLENVNIVVSCGSSSIQAFKLTKSGVLPILPVTDEVLTNLLVFGLKTKLTLNYKYTTEFGGDSDNREVAGDILEYIKANAFRFNERGEKISTNVIFVNQIGYSVLGFNPIDGPVPVPTPSQKIVSLRFYDNFIDNEGKTSVANIFKEVAQGIGMNNAFVVARQCKAYVGMREEELGGQWANQVHNMLRERDLHLYGEKNFSYVLDLGGASGTFYKKDEKGQYKKYTEIKDFMKGEKSPNSFFHPIPENYDYSNIHGLDNFICEFTERFTQIKKLLR